MSVRGKLINKLFKNATQLAKNYDYIVKCDTDLCSEISFLFAYDLETCEDKDIRSFIENKFKNLPEGCGGVGGSEFDGVVITDCSFTINPIEVINVCSTEMDILEYGTVYLKGVVKANGEVEATPTISKLMTSTAKTNSINIASVYLSVVLIYNAIAKGISTGIEKITRVIKSQAIAKAASNPFIKLTRVVSGSINVVNSISNGLTTIAKNIYSLNKTNSISSGSTQIAKLVSSTGVIFSKIIAEIEIRSAGILGITTGLSIATGQVVKSVILTSTSTVKSIVDNVMSVARSVTSNTKSNSISQAVVFLTANISSTAKGIAISFGNAATGILEGIAKSNSIVITNIIRIINLFSVSVVKESSTATTFLTRVIKTASVASAKVISEIKLTIAVIAQGFSKALISTNVTVSKIANSKSNAKGLVVSQSKIVKIATANSIAKSLITSVAMLRIIILESLSKNKTLSTGDLKLTKSLRLSLNSNSSFASTLSVTTPVVSDPYFNSVSLLLHLNGTNNTSVVTDSSPRPKTATINGGALLKTDIYKFGTASMYFDGVNDSISFANNTDFQFGTGNFTCEFFIYLVAERPSGSNMVLTSISTTGGDGSTGWQLGFYSSTYRNRLYLYGGSGSANTYTDLTLNVWYHIAFTRDVNTWRLFKDGILQGSFSDTAVVNTSTTRSLYFAGVLSTLAMNAYLDEIRITKGVARYTANFTSPTAEFPNQ